MKKHLPFLAVSTALLAFPAIGKVIYGQDDRVEVFNATKDQQLKARSTATMIPKQSISLPNKKGIVKIEQGTLRQTIEQEFNSKKEENPLSLLLSKGKKITFCKEERFVDQPNPGVCSGFLIAPDLLVTAGHCADIENVCNDFQWVFDFKIDQKTKKAGVNFDASNIYSCKKVITSSLIDVLRTDFALIQLDRVVEGRAPLKVRTGGTVNPGSPLFVIGSPSGLPLKVADNANVRSNIHPLYFSANLDTYQGSSGSAVFNEETGMIEGILVGGEKDFVPNIAKMCVQSNRCSDLGCHGEAVSKITSLPEIGIYETLNQAIEYGDIELLKSVFKLNIWVDFNLADGETALIKAAKANQGEALKFLLKNGADKDHKDVLGKTALDHALESNSSDVMEILRE